MIAILVAVKQELRPILRRAQASQIIRQQHLDFYEGTLAGQPVALLALGVGKECARIAAETTIRCYRPDLVISAGFGGGLVDQVEDGDIVIGTEILDLLGDLGSELRCRTTHKAPTVPQFSSLPAQLRVHYGRIITTDDMILKSANKIRVGRAVQALSVDMETSAVAAVCEAANTNFLAVRCITDNDHESLPAEFNDFFVLGQLRARRVMSVCARHPGVVLKLARLGIRARVAGRNLADFLEAALPQLHLPTLAARDF